MLSLIIPPSISSPTHHSCQVINGSLTALMSSAAHPEHRAKLDSERVRRLFLLYCSRLRRALTSPRYCYFSGFAAVAPRLIARLKEKLLGSFRLEAAEAALMGQLALWTRACECSVAAGVHDCLGEGLTHGLVAMGGGSGGTGENGGGSGAETAAAAAGRGGVSLQ